MTVSKGISASYIRTHNVPPHLWYNVYTDEGWQTVDFDYAAYALYQPQYGYHWTNKHAFLLQTELVGVPVVNQRTYTDDQCRRIAERVIVPKVLWLRSIGLDVNLNDYRQHTNSSGSASVNWHGRMSEQEMADFNGVMAHIDAWGNDHWDCSIENIALMCSHAQSLIKGNGPVPQPTERKDIMKRVLDSDGTGYILDGMKAYPMTGYPMSVHEAIGDVEPYATLKGGGYLKVDKASLAMAYDVQPVK
jgi:hypothetical protein